MGYSVADENFLRRYHPDLPILNVTPRGGNEHRAGEWVDLDSLRQAQRIYTEIALRFGEYPT